MNFNEIIFFNHQKFNIKKKKNSIFIIINFFFKGDPNPRIRIRTDDNLPRTDNHFYRNCRPSVSIHFQFTLSLKKKKKNKINKL